MKRGRPRSADKRRMVTIHISPMARIILDVITDERPKFNFSRYVSECMIRDFGESEESIIEKALKLEIGQDNETIAKARETQDMKIKRLEQIRKDKINRITNSDIKIESGESR